MDKKSEYEISSFVNEGILEIVLTGEVKKSNVKKLQDEVIAIEKEMKVTNVLIDVRAIKGRFGFSEAYERVRNYPTDKPRVNCAVVDLTENAGYENFHEITGRNAGLSLKWFTDIDAARVWLKSKQSK